MERSQALLLTKPNNAVAPIDLETPQTGSNIHLKFDSRKAIGDDVMRKGVLRILYWACFRGKKQVAERLIRMGYSPFVKTLNKKNALMAAIEGQQLEIIKMIIGFSY